jgi:hypothetical protein
MTTSSEYSFPIFISSTDYNLIDLRAELAKYLTDLGYKPILSSSEGFHDNSPLLEPWESCLQVLQSAFVMVLVIDSKYGEKFEWKNFEPIFGGRKVSPTHAEFLFAHKTKMRMLIFIRKELMTYYQVYRNTIKSLNGDKDIAKEHLSKSLPKHIAFETLEFIEEVKTARPILWVKSFENVTDIKKEIQKKMLNELAELFLFRNKHLETVVRAFSTILDDLPEDKRKETLEKIGATKELINEVESQTKVILDLKKEKDKILANYNEKSEELEKAKKAKKKETSTLQNKVDKLTEELENLDSRIYNHELNNADFLISGSASQYANPSFNNFLNFNTISRYPNSNPLAINPSTGSLFSSSLFNNLPKCEKCQGKGPMSFSAINQLLNTCQTCNRQLCQSCFNGPYRSVILNDECYDCNKNRPIGNFNLRR